MVGVQVPSGKICPKNGEDKQKKENGCANRFLSIDWEK
jgi:hypothetical protein